MTPYEINLLLEINYKTGIGLYNIKKIPVLDTTLYNFNRRGLIKNVTTNPWKEDLWEITKKGKAFCEKICSIDDSDVKFCKECGRLIE